jgi:hypothetical protein
VTRGGAPLSATPTWARAVEAAGHACQCDGRCGRSHARDGGRCPRGTHSPTPARLFVAPADPGVPPERAHTVPADQLMAWCGPCLDGARRHAAAHRRHAEAAEAARAGRPPASQALF